MSNLLIPEVEGGYKDYSELLGTETLELDNGSESIYTTVADARRWILQAEDGEFLNIGRDFYDALSFNSFADRFYARANPFSGSDASHIQFFGDASVYPGADSGNDSTFAYFNHTTKTIRMPVVNPASIATPIIGHMAIKSAAMGSDTERLNIYTNGDGWKRVSYLEDFSEVAFSGSYGDLSDTPSYASVALSGDYEDLINTPDLSGYLVSPMTTLGDMIYGGPAGAATRLAGNTSTTKMFLSQTGDSVNSAAPAWSTVSKSDVGLGNVENTALSTWAGSTNITTLGTIATASIPYSVLTGTPTIPAGANPSATIGLTANNGSATSFMRSDGTPALSQAIAPTWTAVHTYQQTIANTSTDGVVLENPTVTISAAIPIQRVPRIRMVGHVWSTGAGGSDRRIDFTIDPVFASASTGSGRLAFFSGANGGALSEIFAIQDAGYVNIQSWTSGSQGLYNVASTSSSSSLIFFVGRNSSAGSSAQAQAFSLGNNTAADLAKIGLNGANNTTLGGGGSFNIWTTSTNAIVLSTNSLPRFYVATDGVVSSLMSNATTAAIDTVFQIRHNSTGTAAAGFGSKFQFALESSTTDDTAAADIDVSWITATHASRASSMAFSVYSVATAQEGYRITGDAGGLKMAWFAGTPVAKQTITALTNSVTSGGSSYVIANYTDLTIYANDAATIRNNFYRLSEAVLQLETALRNYNLGT